MDPSNSLSSELDEERALEILLDAFGSVCSLEEITSAYCKAGCDVNAAVEVLFHLQDSRSADGHNSSNEIVSNAKSVGSQLENAVDSSYLYKNSHVSKSKKLTVSTGSISAVLGKAYSRPTSSQAEPLKATKPPKLEVKEPLVDDVTCKTVISDLAPESDLVSKKETVEFLFSMLGDGFKLNKDMINDVLGSCGFDLKKTMDHLLAMASSDLSKGKVVSAGSTEELTDELPTLGPQHFEENLVPSSARRKSAGLYSMTKNKSDVPREVLESLFSAPGISEETPKRTRLPLGLNRTRVIGQKAASPFDDIDPKPLADVTKEVKKVENEEDDYLVLRRAAKKSWEMMKEYYEAAVDAYTRGDHAKAVYLREQGKYHNKMAREADEKSAREILHTRCVKTRKDFILDLHTHDAKEAVKLLKCHLRSLAGISSFQSLKVIVDTDVVDITKGKRRKMVLKLLEKELIEWTEENSGTICIQVDAIDLNKLSFLKKI